MQGTLMDWLRQPPKQAQALASKREQYPTSVTGRKVDDQDVQSPAIPKTAVTAQSCGPFKPTRPLPAAATIEPCESRYINEFKRLNAVLLPIPYPSKFYDEILQDETTAELTRLAIWRQDGTTKERASNGKIVAAIRCRLLQDPEQPERSMLYISTIGTLAPFRGHGLASHLLANVTRTAIDKYGIASVRAHVWEDNENGLAWYASQGFKQDQRIENYYRRLAPKSAAYMMVRRTQPSDLLKF